MSKAVERHVPRIGQPSASARREPFSRAKRGG